MKIAVGYDGSEPAKLALNVARDHARSFKAEKVYIMTALEGYPADQMSHKKAAEANLAYAEGFFKKEGLPYEAVLLTKGLTAGEAIVSFAQENGIDEIIVGVVQASKVGKLIFGSTAQHVILHAPCPVITVK